MKTHVIFSILLICTITAAFAAPELGTVRTVTIPLGPGNDQVGVERGDGENWKPLFFSADSDGNVYIPDFYKGRIAVFSGKGKFLQPLKATVGISPRMNYFTRTPDGLFVTFDSFTVYCLEKTGALRWKYQFPFGTIPQAIHATDSGIFVVVPASDGGESAVAFSWNSPNPLGAFSKKSGTVSVPVILTTSGSAFTPTLSSMKALANESFVPDSRLSGNETLAGVLPDGSSVWRSRDGNETYCRLTTRGTMISNGSILSQKTNESSFWTFISTIGTIWKNNFTDNAIICTEYTFK